MKKWGFPKRQGLTVRYDPDLKNVAQATGDQLILVGPEAFHSEGYLAATLDHEFTHIEQYVNYRAAKMDTKGFNLNEVEAYNRELGHAGRFGLTADEISDIRVNRDWYYARIGTWDRVGTWFGNYTPSTADLYRQRPRRRIKRRRFWGRRPLSPSSNGGAYLLQRIAVLCAAVVLAALGSASCSRHSLAENSERARGAVTASLTIVQPSTGVRASDSKVNLILKNEGHSTFWVNKRGFSGYHGQPSPFRELSLEAWDSNGRPVESYCFDRSEMAKKSDYVLLEPGTTLHFKVGLHCFKFKGPGTYSLVAHYQDGNPNLTTVPGPPVLAGDIASSPVTIQVME